MKKIRFLAVTLVYSESLYAYGKHGFISFNLKALCFIQDKHMANKNKSLQDHLEVVSKTGCNQECHHFSTWLQIHSDE